MMRNAGQPWSRSNLFTRLIVASLAAVLIRADSAPQSLYWIAPMNNGDQSMAYDISDDGSHIVGTYHDPVNRKTRAFVWDPILNSFTDLGDLGGGNAVARGISGNGQVIVGWSQDNAGVWRAVYWENNTIQQIPTSENRQSFAYDVSNDGSVIVGTCDVAVGGTRGFYFKKSQNTFGTLPPPPNRLSDPTDAYAVSPDGTLVGGSAPWSWCVLACLWNISMDPPQGPIYGRRLPGRQICTQVRHISVHSGGVTIVGGGAYLQSFKQTKQSFNWNIDWNDYTTYYPNWDAVSDLGYPTSANAASGDGSIVVGSAHVGRFVRAVRWNQNGQMQDLNAAYASLLQDGSYLITALSITPDGRYIVGQGYNATTGRYEGFLLDTQGGGYLRSRGDANNDGCVDDADLLQVLFAFGATGAVNEDLNNDSVVDDADLLLVLFNFGLGC
jgi:probable HAF family extracellular repeat protein